jgi:hypothetical protein
MAMVNRAYGTAYSDLCYGFNVFWQRHLPVLRLDSTTPAPRDGTKRLWGDGFEIETLIAIRVAVARLAVVEVPSFEHSRIHGASNLTALGDGLRVLRTILTERRIRNTAAKMSRPRRPRTPVHAFSEAAELEEFASFLMPAEFMPARKMKPQPSSRVAP